jgi:hypothetical protein
LAATIAKNLPAIFAAIGAIPPRLIAATELDKKSRFAEDGRRKGFRQHVTTEKRAMKGLLALIAIIGAIVIGVGLSRGWFTVNKETIREDPAVISAKEKLHNLEAQAQEKLDSGKPAQPVTR